MEKIEAEIKNYMLNGDHCKNDSPVLEKDMRKNEKIDFKKIEKILEEDDIEDVEVMSED
jgi:hypothetical protein